MSCPTRRMQPSEDGFDEHLVELHLLKFDFHPLYSWEHVYAQNLQDVVQAYENEVARDQVNACIQRENNIDSSVAAQLDKSIEEYGREIRQAVDEFEEKKEWNQELDELVTEAQKRHEYCNIRLREQYLEELDKYKQAKRKHMKALERQRQRESRQKLESGGAETSLNELEKEDTRILARGHPGRPPTPPPQFNATWVRERAEQQMKKCRRFPGEPKISVSLTESMEVTPEVTCTKLEQ
ncbi:uncharacterized protein DEA37_0007504 [Paragonimus westermani]|uniref:Uncharacterized protein n=1 Tax=Paragonimus westermani TaxID=34504 RepID=A0A5J4NI87_9TREM|nr:uncharacterized protein DEA37_0007504 [Paragonimus westermani]